MIVIIDIKDGMLLNTWNYAYTIKVSSNRTPLCIVVYTAQWVTSCGKTNH